MIESIILIICGLWMAFWIMMLFKNNNTCENHILIMNAICDYNITRLEKNLNTPRIEYDAMEDYDSTMWRLWDWGYKRILPQYQFELIKPYIKTKKGGDVK